MNYIKINNYALCMLLWFLPLGAKAQRSIEFTWQKEQEHRADKQYTEEKHYKKGKLHGVYKKLDAQGNLVTKGCYVAGKRHGKWWELMTMYASYHYIEYNYKHGIITEIFDYSAWGKNKDSPKRIEDHYILQPDARNYTVHEIYWDGKPIGKKQEL
ncbi:toxin-antitoxin system YwqK family antitoxin [Microscilla marina]|uniref:MORN repeat variant n=1 Tax=Microscilla marina ATCC 23134 TaxID=313606 RepID=A1ZXN3_MICM2|nr:hypothetical protein [Microscilla marina]EAY24811.1 conserved hypothetical protein [Microscilla marina ATCC 23134]